MPRYRTSKYNIGDLVTIISIENSGSMNEMKEMIGQTYPIEGIPDHTSLIINDFFWSAVDVEKFIPDEGPKKQKKFDTNNLVIEGGT